MRLELSNHPPINFDPIDISQSELKSWRRCKRKWFFKHVWRLRPNATKPPLAIGGMFHDTVAEFFDPTTPIEDRSEKLLLEIFHDVYKERISQDFTDPEGKVYVLLDSILRNYYKLYGKEWEFVLVEDNFRVPIFVQGALTGYIHGRLDGVIKDEVGQFWIVEHKTTKRFSFDHLSIDPQADLYALAGSKLFGEAFAGLWYDYVRTKPSKKNPNFTRIKVTRSPDALASIESGIAHDMIAISQATPFFLTPTFDRDCLWYCSYLSLCHGIRANVNLESMVLAGYHIRQDPEEYE